MITAEEKAKIENAPLLYEWEILLPLGPNMHKVRLIYALTVFILFLGSAIYFNGNIYLIISAIIIPPAIQFFMWADYQYHYYLTRYGYYYTSYQKVPEFGYKLTAIFMVLGVIVAIVGTMVVGPVAFVGGGMFLLTGILGKGLPLGPDLTRNYKIINPKFKHVLFVMEERSQLWIKTDPMQRKYNYIIDYSKTDEQKLINIFTKILSNPETYHIKSDEEFSKHPRAQELIKNRID
ncbi:hypothetical protein [Celerinatantimonas sp. MCCC 1A17872]|uniref:hypothetical protein n=1 Tax=Celerinatantimonas sp. MCCC 1A17872 TaxID=3177514 RepID=UPI0038C429F1